MYSNVEVSIMQKKIYISLIAALLGLWAGEAAAQGTTWRETPTWAADETWAADSLRVPRWEPHVGVTTGFLGTGHGDNRLYTSVAPSLTFRPSERWAITGGLRLTSDFGLNSHYMAQPERNLAPLRNGGTTTASAYIEAAYQATDRLWIAANLYHLGGQYAPLFGPANGTTLDLSVTALSAEAAYRFGNNNWLHLSFTVVRDGTGALPYLWWENWHTGGWGGYCGYNGFNGYNTWDRWNGWF